MARVGLVVSIFLLAVAGPIEVPLAYEVATMNYWRDAESTPISNLRIGDTAKVIGTLSSPREVALGGHYVSGEAWKWFWNTTDVFSIEDSTGAISVLADAPFQVVPGRHLPTYVELRSPTWGYVMPSVYLDGDEAAIVGTVVGSSGAPELRALLIAPSDAQFLPSVTSTVFAWTIPGFFFAVGLAVLLLRTGRRRLHRQATSGRAPKEFPAEYGARDPSLEWRTNEPPASLRAHTSLIAAVIALVGYAAISTVAFSAEGINHRLTAIVLFALPNMAVFIAVFSRIYGTPSPTAIAVSDRGLHPWFEKPIDRYQLQNVLAWSDFGDYEKRQKKFRTRQHGPMDAVSYFAHNLRLSRSNADDLRVAWEVRRSNFVPPDGLAPSRARLS